MPENSKFYLTTPIYYVNARPHIGHAYSTIAADVLARRHRLLGDDVFFLTGTDEHGQKVQRSAEAAGIPPQQFADEVSATFRSLWDRMGITYNDYIRTTDDRHKIGVQHLWRRLEASGDIYLSSYTGAYCVSDEAFVDLPAGTPCPDCGRPLEIVTEENYFFKLSAYQEKLIDLIESGTLRIQPETTKNEVLSFLYGSFKEVFDDYRQAKTDNPGLLEPPPIEGERAGPDNQGAFRLGVENGKLGRNKNGSFFVKGALKDLSISRTTFNWGIKVPTSESVILSGAKNPGSSSEAPQNHVIYVWLDALANYITAIGYGAEDRDDLTPEQKQAEKAKFDKYWPADVHLVGKEITRFHCVYWPAFLMAAGIPTPKSVVANGWLLFEESKMSKSRGNVVRTETILDAFGEHYRASLVKAGQPEPDKRDCDLFAADVLRYFLLREIPFGQDGSFSFDALITRYNADLVNGYGNLVSRTLNLVTQNFPSGVPETREPWLVASLSPNSPDVIKDAGLFLGTGLLIEAMVHRAGTLPDQFDEFRFHSYIFNVLLGMGEVDAYLSAQKPWVLAKQDEEESKPKLAEVLHTAAESIRIITALLHPIMPHTTAKVWAQLGLGDIEAAARNGELKDLKWGGLQPGTKLGALAPIFPRADKGLAQIMTDMEAPATPAPTTTEATAAAPAATQAAPASTENVQQTTDNATKTITIDDFVKIDLRVAQIVVAERIPKADKLLRLEVDLGYEKRQILSGIAEWYTPEELIGRRIAIIANLAPRKMRGLESHGMLLAASGEDHSSKPILASFSDEIALGSKIR